MTETTEHNEPTAEAGRVDPVVRPAAWMRNDGAKAITDDELLAWLESGNGNIVEDYTMPLYQTVPESMEAEIGELLRMNGAQAQTIVALRTALKEICEWTDRYTSHGHPITVVAQRALDIGHNT